jgi:hypothetical protein
VHFPHQAILQFSADTICVSYNLIQLDTNYLKLAQTPHIKGSIPQDWSPSSPPVYMPVEVVGPQVTQTPVPFLQIQGSYTLLLRSYDFL